MGGRDSELLVEVAWLSSCIEGRSGDWVSFSRCINRGSMVAIVK
jgi:hypothetical protein